MAKMPDSIEHYIANARLYFDAATKFPSPTNYAVEILLLLTSWENIALADGELAAWARDELLDGKLHKDHAAKFKGAPAIFRTIVGPSGTPARTIEFSTGHQLSELRQACQYGSNTESKDVRVLFDKYWHTDDFRRDLAAKIEWVELWVSVHNQNS